MLRLVERLSVAGLASRITRRFWASEEANVAEIKRLDIKLGLSSRSRFRRSRISSAMRRRYGCETPKLAPAGCQQLLMVSPCRYDFFRRLRQQSEDNYQSAKQAYAAKIIRILERDFIPGLSEHIETQVVGSPLTNEYFVGAPHGNYYGVPLDPDHQNAFHLNYRSPFANLFYVGTTSGMPGMAPTRS